jgi:hypothetical protein
MLPTESFGERLPADLVAGPRYDPTGSRIRYPDQVTMKQHPLLCLALLGWVLSGCPEETSEVAQSHPAPEKDALTHFCRHMAKGPSVALMGLPASQRQAGWLAEMTDAAAAANIQGWPSFRASLVAIGPQDKQAWLELGVKRHGLQSECAVILVESR